MSNNNSSGTAAIAAFTLISLLAMNIFFFYLAAKEMGTPTTVEATIVNKRYIPKKVIQYEKYYYRTGWRIEEEVYPAEYWFDYNYQGEYITQEVEEYQYNLYDVGENQSIVIYLSLIHI